MKLTFISPRLALQKGDFLGSGIPYWPLELITLAAYARQVGDIIYLIDQFGANPSHLTDAGDHYLQGEPIESPLFRNGLTESEAFLLFAISYMSHDELLSVCRCLKINFPNKPVAILENSQAVTGYSLPQMASTFFQAGSDMLICGEPYVNWQAIKSRIAGQDIDPSVIPNVITSTTQHNFKRLTEKNMKYPIPAWDLVNLGGYWHLPYSHGPKTARFLPVFTSRGCPYPCDFCVAPETNNRIWRGNDPLQVVDEIITLRDCFKVNDFQIEDLNPTIDHHRWDRICELLIERQANVHFYFVSGTKAETVHIDSVPLLAKAGCRYLSFSPESGSERLMRVIGKKFNYQHGLDLVAACKAQGIRTQACFLIGHPAETENDYIASRQYLIQLVKAGLDEVAVFVVSPFAGSSLYANRNISIANASALTSFSPKGRSGYSILESHRRKLIKTFFVQKGMQGMELWIQGWRALFGVPQTKMENLPRRMVYISWLIIKEKCKLRRRKS